MNSGFFPSGAVDGSQIAQRTVAVAALTLAGILANAGSIQLFFDVEFIFGSVFAVLVLLRYGLGAAVISGSIIAGYTYFMWLHPYAVVVFSLEILVVGLIARRRDTSELLLWDTAYWLLLGMPLVYVFYGVVMDLPLVNVAVIMVKQGVNGVLNVALAIGINVAFLLIGARRRGRVLDALPSFRAIISVVTVLMVMVPVIVAIAYFSRIEARRMEEDIVLRTRDAAHATRRIIELWENEVIGTMTSLVTMFESNSDYYFSREQDTPILVDLFQYTFHRIGTTDVNGSVLAHGFREHPLEGHGFDRIDVPGGHENGIHAAIISSPYGDDPVPVLRVIHSRDGKIVFGDVDLAQLERLLLEALLLEATNNSGVELLLLDTDDTVIAGNTPGVQRYDTYRVPEGALPVDSAGSTFLSVPDLPLNSGIMNRWRATRVISLDQLTDFNRWTIVVHSGFEEYYDRLHGIVSGNLNVMGIITVLTVLFSVLLSRTMVRPLQRLSDNTRRFADRLETDQLRDETGAVVFVPAGSMIDEVDRLEESFLRTGRRVREYVGELRTARAQAEASSTAKSQFLANMSHEIRTPMNSILGFSELLREQRDVDTRERGYLDNIHRSGRALMRLLDDVLDLSRAESGCAAVDLQAVDPRSCMTDVRAVFSDAAARKEISFEMRADASVPAALRLDETRLRQVLLNLVGNAVKFTDRGGVVVAMHAERASAERTSAARNQLARVTLRISVRDTGIGIAPDQLERIFEPFTQHQEQDTRTYGGTGLGLTISKRLVETMSGTISSHSAPGSGTEFLVTIPDLEVVTAAYASEAPAPAAHVNPPDSGLAGKRVLVAEDDQVNVLVLKEYLKDSGVLVEAVENGEKAVAAAQVNPPDLILMDLQMPVLDGRAATRRLAKDQRTSGIPVVALTAGSVRGEGEDESRLFAQVLLKPYQRADLERVIYAALRMEVPFPDGDRNDTGRGGDQPVGPIRPPRQAIPQDLIDEFSDRLGDDFQSLRSGLNIPDLVVFCRNLRSLPGATEIPELRQIATRLERLAERVQVEEIIVQLEELVVLLRTS